MASFGEKAKNKLERIKIDGSLVSNFKNISGSVDIYEGLKGYNKIKKH